jgi:hypothetical protein
MMCGVMCCVVLVISGTNKRNKAELKEIIRKEVGMTKLQG